LQAACFDLAEVSGLRLMRLDLPQAFADAHPARSSPSKAHAN
jgi:hypothetical protein